MALVAQPPRRKCATSSPSAGRSAIYPSQRRPAASNQLLLLSRNPYVNPLARPVHNPSSRLSVSESSLTTRSQTAAKTALLLDNTQLKESIVQVSSAASLEELSADKSGQPSGSSEEISQEDKPRARILAEYLAHGYTVSDKAVERAIALDSESLAPHVQTACTANTTYRPTRLLRPLYISSPAVRYQVPCDRQSEKR